MDVIELEVEVIELYTGLEVTDLTDDVELIVL